MWASNYVLLTPTNKRKNPYKLREGRSSRGNKGSCQECFTLQLLKRSSVFCLLDQHYDLQWVAVFGVHLLLSQKEALDNMQAWRQSYVNVTSLLFWTQQLGTSFEKWRKNDTELMRGHLMSVFPALTSTWTNAPRDENSAKWAVSVLYLQKKIQLFLSRI